jgi:hypothetical protein
MKPFCRIEYVSSDRDVGMLRQACRGKVQRLRICDLFRLLLPPRAIDEIG